MGVTRLDINQLRYFIAVAETLNFSEAARRTGISQPSISHSIGELEKQFGAPLFLRSKRSVIITDAGKELLPNAVEMVELAEKTAFRIKQMETGHCGHISISALTTSSAAVSKCLAVFSKRWPDIMVDITFTTGRSQVVAMNEAKYDFQFAVQEMVPEGDTYDCIVSHTDYLCVAFPTDHPMAGRPLDFSKLQGERFIGVSETDGPALYNIIQKVCQARHFKPNVVCQFDRAEAVLLSVGAGVGISIIPEAVSRVFYADNVSFSRIPEADAIRTYVVAWHKNMTNPSARLFLEVVRELYDPSHG